MKKSLRERFKSRVVVDKRTGCHIWNGSVASNGYGQLYLHRLKRCEGTHRIAWELKHGKIPKGLFVLHDCPKGDNKRCVNVRHLFLGTQDDNMKDMAKKGRRDVTGERNPKVKLTKKQVRLIRRCQILNVRSSLLAHFFKVRQATIKSVFSKENWAHVLP